ncbi:hypothetical protein KUH03_34375 [Sphingobacterium sp. E70]|uniref:hypothetical protein n=1 Tax=Sphingobacterium sp. E70 TaxID=2853439 RepID=UPI00211C59AA|nr:hypothetical protein [Sphingobacterium sp. E70]ULT24108.1 hypothetical protein KUH03_34375 [Sphingobacterium sp. E70]
MFVYFGVLFGGLSWVVYAKNQKFIIALRGLNSRDLDIYQRYTRRLVRIYATIAPYLFQEHELVFFPFLEVKNSDQSDSPYRDQDYSEPPWPE